MKLTLGVMMMAAAELPEPSPIPISVKQRVRGNVFTAFSVKMQRQMSFYSRLEYDHWLLLEMDPNVARICEQPLQIRDKVDGKTINFRFDLWTRGDTDSGEYVEVASEAQLIEDEDGRRVPRQWPLVERWCHQRQVSCRFVTDAWTYANPIHLANCARALAFAHAGDRLDDSRLVRHVLHHARQENGIDLQTLLSRLVGDGTANVLSTVFLLIHKGQLETNLAAEPLSMALIVETRDG